MACGGRNVARVKINRSSDAIYSSFILLLDDKNHPGGGSGGETGGSNRLAVVGTAGRAGWTVTAV